MRRRHFKRSRYGIRTLATVCVATLVLAACSVPETTDTTAGVAEGPGDTAAGAELVDEPLRIGWPWEITSLDPISQGYNASGFGYGEALLRQTETGVPEPWVLQSAEAISPLEWELTLHQGVTFQNGNPLDAEALAALLNHQIAQNPNLNPVLPGAVAEATGPTTVTFTTTSPVADMPSLLADDQVMMITVYDVEALESAGDDEQALIEAGIYTGPYKVTELNGSEMVMERNDEYWQGTPALPGVVVKFIVDDQARILAVQSGELDIAMQAPSEAAQTLANSSTAQYVEAGNGTLGPRVLFNLQQTPIDDALVRRALSLAVDYETVANDLLDGRADVAQGLYPMHLPFAVPNQVHDPDAARDLLDEAGWTDSGDGVRTKDGQKLELTLVTYRLDPDLPSIAVAMQSQFEEVGVALEIREIESSSGLWSGDLTDWHLAMLITSYFGYGNVIGTTLGHFAKDGAYNISVADPEIDKIAAELSSTFEEDQRYDLLRELQGLVIAEQAYTIVVAEKPVAVVTSNEWANYEPSLMFHNVDWQTAP